MLLLAKSKCGHDKGRIYLVLASDEEEGFFALADGKLRTVENPKKKRMKHVQLIKHPDSDLVSLYEEAETVSDHLIRKILNEYSRRKENCLRRM